MKRAFERKILVAKVAGELLFLYGLLAWLDGVVIQFTNPMWLAMPVSHLFLWLRTDTFTILSFIASGVGFFIWRVTVELIKSEQNKATH
jgi:type IV secretory pathway TrbD component